MPGKTSIAEVHLDVSPGEKPAILAPDSERPFRILLMGDFSGRSLRNDPPATRWKPVEIDRDNFDEVLGRMGAMVNVGAAAAESKLCFLFRELDDFHPDRIYESHALFENVRLLRRKSANPKTFDEAAAEIRKWSRAESPRKEKPAAAAPPAAPLPKGGNLLDAILGGAGTAPARPSRRRDDFQEFVENIAAAGAVPATD